MKPQKSILLIVILLISYFSYSQKNSRIFTPELSFTVNTGVNLFFGDVKQYRIYPVFKNNSEWNYAFSFKGVYQLCPTFGIGGQLFRGKVSGTQRTNNIFFKADIFEYNFFTHITILNIFNKKKQLRFNSSGIIGLGFTNYNTRLSSLNNNETKGTNGYGDGKGMDGRTLETVLPIGLDLNYFLSPSLALNLESTFHFVNNDLLDLEQNGFKYDKYWYTSIGVTYKFNVKNRKNKESKKTSMKIEREKSPIFLDTISPIKTTRKKAVEVINDTIIENKTDKKSLPTENLLNKNLIENSRKDVETDSVLIDRYEQYPVKDTYVYKVQILAVTKLRDQVSIYLKDIKKEFEIQTQKHNDLIIITVGAFDSYQEAKNLCQKLKSKYEIRDSFVVTFKNGKRIH